MTMLPPAMGHGHHQIQSRGPCRSWESQEVMEIEIGGEKKPTLAVEKKHCPTERYLSTEHQDAKQKSWTVTT